MLVAVNLAILRAHGSHARWRAAPRHVGALSAQPVAIVDVTVIPMDRETTLAQQTVVVDGGRIVSLGPAASTAVPDDAMIVGNSDLALDVFRVPCRGVR